MADTPDESELLSHVPAVLSNVVSARGGVTVDELADVSGLGEDIGGVAQLRDLGDDGAR